ncbi:MAG: D-sedoheptulose 7-phosphate isomerase [Syntrophobacteraceae bacterium]|jgi:D-sedoheptulose 7-phosphate isomerase|nr:D-sedoheptulose 7-phosphate isomerase [Syntrophobacteraceae bacterium]
MDETLRDFCRRTAAQVFEESIGLKQAVARASTDLIIDMAEVVVQAFRGQHRLFLFGNGGSAADAQHLAAEFVNRFQRERIPLPAIALTVDTSILTSIGNDYRFDDIFLKQLQALGQPGDVALGISTSGSSPNVVLALRWAREHGLQTVGWAGATLGDMDTYCDLILHVPSRTTARIQECHITVGHILCGLVDEILFGREEHPA